MAYKDILVVLDDTADCEERLRVAMRVAGQFDAHLIGLFVVGAQFIPTYAEVQIPPEVFEQRRNAADEARARVQDKFERAMRGNGLTAEWRTVEGDPLNVISLHLRYADLAVIGQDNPAVLGAFGTGANLVEHVIMACGRPVLAVPYVGRYPQVGSRVMVAWDAGREAARAVADALPFLQGAASVATLAVNPRSGAVAGSHGEVPGADISLHLARHGVKVEAQAIDSGNVSVADMILSRMADQSIDLLVMGAYGHARVRQLVLGGVTRSVLRQMTAPVLMSH